MLIKAVNGIETWGPSRIGEAERDGTQDHRNATFAPRSLPQLLHRLRREGAPAIPIELDGF